MFADVLTKPLQRIAHKKCVQGIGLVTIILYFYTLSFGPIITDVKFFVLCVVFLREF